MIKKLADFFRKPVVYKTLILLFVALVVYMEFIAPIFGTWSPRQPTMLDGMIMRGR